MRAKLFTFGLKEDKGTPEYVCPSCNRIGLLFDLAENNYKAQDQLCRICGFRISDKHDNAVKNWNDAWTECGSEILFDKPYEERCEYYRKTFYSFYGKYFYVASDMEIENKEFDDKLFSQYGFLHKKDDTKKILVRCDDGNFWEFSYETNTIMYLDDLKKYFAVGEDHERFYLFASDGLTHGDSSATDAYRGGYIGFVPDMFPLYYPLFYPDDRECILMDQDKKKYYFKIECSVA